MADMYVEKVAAGLRAMKETPDAFLYFSDHDILARDFRGYEEYEIIGFPVYRTEGEFKLYGFKNNMVPFVPVWLCDRDCGPLSIPLFRDGYLGEIK